MTQRYAAFGGVLSSDLAIDELSAVAPDAPVNWTLRVSDQTPPGLGAPLGVDIVFGDVRVHGYLGDYGWSLVFDDTGRFDVSPDGTLLTWYRPPDVSLHSALADVTSRVLALALHAGGLYSMHASAVSTDGVGIAFLAPKFHGKSTLCGALVLAGARAISDDTLPVRLGPSPMLLPGVPRLRLWSDSAHRMFGIGDQGEEARKHLVDQLSAAQVEGDPVPFRAAYVLNPVPGLSDGAAVLRRRVDTVAATMSVLTHAKLGPILTGPESAELLSRAAAVAAAVPVYTLDIVRDLSRLDEVAGTLRRWHREGAA